MSEPQPDGAVGKQEEGSVQEGKVGEEEPSSGVKKAAARIRKQWHVDIDYASNKYWNDRYSDRKEAFEWLQSWKKMQGLLTGMLQESSQILNLGCGTSPLPFDLWDAGFHDILNVDYSDVCIEQMQAKAADGENKWQSLKWMVSDVTNLELDDNSFDVIFDKSTLDALACADGAAGQMDKMIHEAYRVLRPGGLYICISFGTPKQRVPTFKRSKLDWKFATRHVHKFLSTPPPGDDDPSVIPHEVDFYHWIYLLRKPGTEATLGADADSVVDPVDPSALPQASKPSETAVTPAATTVVDVATAATDPTDAN